MSAIFSKPKIRPLRIGSSISANDRKEFIGEFRSAGRVAAAVAAGAAALLFFVFFVVEVRHQDTSRETNFGRLLLVGFLAAISVVLVRKRTLSATGYCVLSAGSATVALLGTVYLVSLSASAGVERGTSATAAFVFGLFLHYSFLRLPLWLAALIGWVAALAAVAMTPTALGGDALRHAIYLGFTNIFGMVLCHLIESREFDLFIQRRATEAARSEAQLRQSEAEEAVRQKTRLVASVSHDLRQPMAAAGTYLDVLKHRLADGDVSGAIPVAQKAREAVTALGGTLDHLLSVARYEGGRVSLQSEWLQIGPVLESLCESYVEEAARRGVQLKLFLPKRPVEVMTDRRSVERLVSNLISNALKFTLGREGRVGRVLVAVRLRGEDALIDVYDTGIGIRADAQESIWEPYSQLEDAYLGSERGLGLGLYLVRTMVDQLPRHRIALQSVVGKGSRFSLSLPGRLALQSPLPAIEAQFPQEPVVESPVWGAYVMVIEDDPTAREAMALLLRELDVIVCSGATVAEALDDHGVSERFIDAVICDFRLPHAMDGFAAVRTVREALGYSPWAIVVTGEVAVSSLLAHSGPDTVVLQKPVSSELLLRHLSDAVAASQRLHEA